MDTFTLKLFTRCVIQVEQTREQQRPYIGNGGAHGVSLFAEDIPAGDGTGSEDWLWEAELLEALLKLRAQLPQVCRSVDVALYVRREHGDTNPQTFSANTWSDTILPVPVAPVMRP
jgi:hypothetical protein